MQLPCDKPCSLVLQTRARLKEDSRTLLDIHKQSGIPFYWLRKFAQGHIASPPANRVQYLYEFLFRTELKVAA